jgi:hypothetical protein
LLALVGLVALAVLVGNTTKPKQFLGILIDSRGRYSLTHFQTVLWTIVVLASLIGVFVASGLSPGSLDVPPTLLGLIGVSGGSAVFGTAVKGAKDASSARVSRDDQVKMSDGTSRDTPARLAQIWLEEEGDFADKVVNITKFQNLVFTLVVLAVYIGLAVTTQALPELPPNVVWLIGVSHAGYVGGKVPDRK